MDAGDVASAAMELHTVALDAYLTFETAPFAGRSELAEALLEVAASAAKQNPGLGSPGGLRASPLQYASPRSRSPSVPRGPQSQVQHFLRVLASSPGQTFEQIRPYTFEAFVAMYNSFVEFVTHGEIDGSALLSPPGSFAKLAKARDLTPTTSDAKVLMMAQNSVKARMSYSSWDAADTERSSSPFGMRASAHDASPRVPGTMAVVTTHADAPQLEGGHKAAAMTATAMTALTAAGGSQPASRDASTHGGSIVKAALREASPVPTRPPMATPGAPAADAGDTAQPVVRGSCAPPPPPLPPSDPREHARLHPVPPPRP